MIMNRSRALGSPSMLSQSSSTTQLDVQPNDHSFEGNSDNAGIAANVKLLLKLIQDQNDAKESDPRKAQRVAGMMSILDDVKTRIQKSQNVGRKPELRRCNTDLRLNGPAEDKRSKETAIDEKEQLRRSLSASLASRKSLEIMCTSLGKEKDIIAKELARKVHEFHEMEEHINDLRAQNDKLLAKLKACASEHKEKKYVGDEVNANPGNAALHERNQELSEQLLRSLEGCRSLKRKIKVAHKKNNAMQQAMEEIGMNVQDGIGRIRRLKEGTAAEHADIEEKFSALQHLLESCYIKISEHKQNEF